jgi:NADPH-dependent 2,4-dienoyl-CoA reductase/sulfur reductase-like enzyme
VADAAGDDADVVIIGSSFIGMETAAALARKDPRPRSITVVGMETVPFERVLGAEVGEVVAGMFAAEGVDLRMKTGVQQLTVSEAGHVTGVELSGGEVLPASCVVLGVGAAPVLPWAKDGAPEGVTVRPDGSIQTDQFLQATAGVYAAGDVATFPYGRECGSEDGLVRIEHFQVAEQQGRVAALNMVGGSHARPYTDVPFFWTVLFGKSLRYTGHARSIDKVCITGDTAAHSFIAYYITRGIVAAVATLGADPAAVAVSSLMRRGVAITEAEVVEGGLDTGGLLRKLQAASQ